MTDSTYLADVSIDGMRYCAKVVIPAEMAVIWGDAAREVTIISAGSDRDQRYQALGRAVEIAKDLTLA